MQGLIQEVRRRCPKGLAVVTGRPRADCDKFLATHGISALFDACVCMEDGPPKPDAFPVARACQLLGVDPKETLMVRVRGQICRSLVVRVCSNHPTS